ADAGIGILITDHNVREVFRTADRVYLITAGKVVTRGTPMELVNDQIAIDSYLGRSFEEDGFTRHFAAQRAAREGTTGSGPATPVLVPGGRSASAVGTAPNAPPPLPPRPLASTVTPPPAFPAAPPSPFATTTPPPANAPIGGPMAAALELEKLRRAVEGLADDRTLKGAMVELVARGSSAVPVLLDALERRDEKLRTRAFEVLKYVAKDQSPLEFAPTAPSDVRTRQIAHLRLKLERRK
ncbi:MAG TPA: LPS export ABC transporter ATP-binding protein, partial [Gemmata sp.]